MLRRPGQAAVRKINISDSESSSYETVEVDDEDVAAKVNAQNEPAVAAPAASAPAPAKAAADDNDDDKPALAGGGDVKGDDDANDDDEPEGDNDKSAVPPQWTTVGKGAEAASGNPHARVVCATCGRNVGGGAAGIYQHVRSPYHLACFLWLRYYGTWDECVTEGQKMSDQAWEDDQRNGPRRVPTNPKRSTKTKKKTGTTPPWTENGPADKKGPGGGPDDDKGPGPEDGFGTLLQMWQMSLQALIGSGKQ